MVVGALVRWWTHLIFGISQLGVYKCSTNMATTSPTRTYRSGTVKFRFLGGDSDDTVTHSSQGDGRALDVEGDFIESGGNFEKQTYQLQRQRTGLDPLRPRA